MNKNNKISKSENKYNNNANRIRFNYKDKNRDKLNKKKFTM